MTTGHVFIASSIDGYIARPDGDLDWLMKQPTDGEEHGYDEFMNSVDGLIMGRGAYEKVLTFGEWPYIKPVIVLSRTLTQDDLRDDLSGRVRICDATPNEIMVMVADEGWQRVYVDGGKIIQAFLRDRLIADMLITRIPVLLGDGIPLFGSLDADVDLVHLETTTFASGLVSSKYRVV